MKHYILNFLMMGICLISGPGCAPVAQHKSSGYLTDYSKLYAINGHTLLYVDCEAIMKISDIVIDPMDFYTHRKGRIYTFSEADRKFIAEHMNGAVRRELSKHYTIVRAKQYDTARVRVAMTDLRKASATSLIGIGTLTVGKMTIEAEIVDCTTGRQLMAVVHSGPAKGFIFEKGMLAPSMAKDQVDDLVHDAIVMMKLEKPEEQRGTTTYRPCISGG